MRDDSINSLIVSGVSFNSHVYRLTLLLDIENVLTPMSQVLNITVESRRGWDDVI